MRVDWVMFKVIRFSKTNWEKNKCFVLSGFFKYIYIFWRKILTFYYTFLPKTKVNEYFTENNFEGQYQ